MAVNEDFPALTLTFSFTRPLNAFGLDVNDLNFTSMSFADSLGNVNPGVLLGDNGGPDGGPEFQNLQFFGVVNANAFTTVQLTFANPTSSDLKLSHALKPWMTRRSADKILRAISCVHSISSPQSPASGDRAFRESARAAPASSRPPPGAGRCSLFRRPRPCFESPRGNARPGFPCARSPSA